MVAVNRRKRRTPAKRFERIVFNLRGGPKVRRRKLEGRDHLVVPCVMITEGVHDGNNGPGLYTEKDTARTAVSWDHMPVVVYHPKTSARTPDVLNTRKVGLVLNTRWDRKAKKLRSEVWLDYQRTKEIDKRIVEAVENGKMVEVSTGLFLYREKRRGVWNTGEKYRWVARNQTPDHLAILPDEVGACSIKDGAGLLQLNSTGEPEATAKVWRRSVRNALKPLGIKVVKNEMSMSEVSRTLSDLLAKKYGEKGQYWRGWVMDVYGDYVVFCDKDGKCYKNPYTKTDTGVKLKGEATPVVRVVDYKPAGDESYVSNRGKGMLSTKKKAAMVKRLVTNSEVWEPKDKKSLMAMPDEQFKKVYKQALTAEKEDDPEDEVQNAVRDEAEKHGFTTVRNSGKKRKKVRPPTEKEWLKNAPASVVAVVNQGKRVLARRKAQLIEIITNNENNPYTEEYLKNQDIDMLEGMAQLARGKSAEEDDEDEEYGGMFKPGFRPDYSGAVGSVPTTKNRRRGEEEDDEDEGEEITLDLPTLNSFKDEDDDKRGKGKKKSGKKTRAA